MHAHTKQDIGNNPAMIIRAENQCYKHKHYTPRQTKFMNSK